MVRVGFSLLIQIVINVKWPMAKGSTLLTDFLTRPQIGLKESLTGMKKNYPPLLQMQLVHMSETQSTKHRNFYNKTEANQKRKRASK